uniref:Myosin motor domain-containing protein n=1 Tax=Plectus sambesii TaxID=2011161 RepID=A0A914X0G8_9BILA
MAFRPVIPRDRRTSYNNSVCSDIHSTTSHEVTDLRQQIRHLTEELQYLRTNLRDDHHTLPPGNLARTHFRHSVTSLPNMGGRPDMKHATSFPSIVEEAGMDVAPALPPRTYRGPPKPLRTFEEFSPLAEQFHPQHAPFLPPKSSRVLEKQQQVQQHQLVQNAVVRRFPAIPPPPPINTRANSSWDASSNQASPISDRPFRRTNSARPREMGSAPPHLSTQLIMPPKELWTVTGNLSALREPVTAGSIAKELETSFKKGICWFELGPLKLFVNPFNDLAENQTSSYRSIMKLTKDLHSGFNDVGSQSVVFCGESGSGKSYLCQQLIKQLCMEFGAADSDLLKTRTATMTVLRGLGSAATVDNMHASKIGFWYEYQIIDGVCSRVKINCCFTDMSRLATRGDGHAFDIFYEMLTGLSAEEKIKFHLGGMDATKLRYLKEPSSTVDGRRRFEAWKSALYTLGIPFSDVMRVLAACLLLGNVHFIDAEGDDVELEGQHELESVAALLGLSALSLYKALTKRTKQANGHKVKTTLSAESANRGRDELATSLYQRCVSAIARRANSIQTPSQPKVCHNGNGSSGISSSDGESS